MGMKVIFSGLATIVGLGGLIMSIHNDSGFWLELFFIGMFAIGLHLTIDSNINDNKEIAKLEMEMYMDRKIEEAKGEIKMEYDLDTKIEEAKDEIMAKVENELKEVKDKIEIVEENMPESESNY